MATTRHDFGVRTVFSTHSTYLPPLSIHHMAWPGSAQRRGLMPPMASAQARLFVLIPMVQYDHRQVRLFWATRQYS